MKIILVPLFGSSLSSYRDITTFMFYLRGEVLGTVAMKQLNYGMPDTIIIY